MGLSLAERFARELTPRQREEWVASLEPDLLKQIARGEWWWVSRDVQTPPKGDWSIFLFLAGRGCVAPWTRVWLPAEGRHERIDVLAKNNRPVQVQSWTPDGPTVAWTDGAPFLKGWDRLYRVEFENGSVITTTDRHRFRTPDAWLALSALRVGQPVSTSVPADPEPRLEDTPSFTPCDTSWTRTESIAPAGFGPYFDMTVPGPANYLAEGVYNHNSGKSRAASEWLVQQALDHPVDKHGFRTEWLSVSQTLSDARTITIEGPSGVLRILDRREIEYRYIRHPKPQIHIGGAKTVIYFEGADSPDCGRGGNYAGAVLEEVCVAKGELVVTSRGLIPIEQVTACDSVLTRNGWRRVVRAGLTAHAVPVIQVHTSHGTVRITGNHQVWTDRGWIRGGELHSGDTVYTCQSILHRYQVKLPVSSPGTVKSGISESAITTTPTGMGSCCTGLCGSKSTDPSTTDTKFTTPTGPGGTTGSRTSNSSPSPSTVPEPSWSATTKRNSGSRQARTAPGDCAKCGPTGHLATSTAPSAGSYSSRQECAPSTADRLAVSRESKNMVPTAVLGVTEANGLTDVYDLEVEGDPEFFAGSGQLLVHNCKWKKARSVWYEGVMPSLRADLINDHPRTFVATTPKPIDIIREWANRTDGSVQMVRGSTFDNAANLSAHMLDEMRRRYEGTSLGRQELYGEIIDSRDGSLWSFGDIDNNRVADIADVEFTHLTVAVDPTLTEDGDLMGVIVIGRDRRNHMYVLADESVPMAGKPAAAHIWQVFYRWGADTVVIEENLAKRWMSDVLTDSYKELRDKDLMFPAGTTAPIKKIDARIGKKLRAEPVAMRYEQNTCHHVGVFSDLEDEMLNFDPTDSHNSPNRMDALVHGARHLMAGEKKRIRMVSPESLWASTL